MIPIPTIDFSIWATGSEADRRALAREVDAACRAVGFLRVSNHGVPQETIAAMEAVTTEFFEQAEDFKLSLQSPSPEINRGYAPMGSEALSYSAGAETPPDLFEAFNVGVQNHTIDVSELEHHVLYAPNIWPDTPIEMKPIWQAYIEEMFQLAQEILRLLAFSLGLDSEFFASKTTQSPDVLRCINYVRHDGTAEPLPGQMRLGAHSDYGTCTILHADPVPGLQILGSDGEWFDVLPEPGTFLINLGDMLAAWTNDRWQSTIHRVVPPTAASGEARRRSYAFFHSADTTAIVEPVATCVDDEHPARYEAMSAGDHLYGKIVSPRSMQITESISTVGDRGANLLSAPAD